MFSNPTQTWRPQQSAGWPEKTSGDPESHGSLVNNITTSPLLQDSKSLSGFLTCRPDLVLMDDLSASVVNLIGTSASVDADCSVSDKCGLLCESRNGGTTGKRSGGCMG